MEDVLIIGAGLAGLSTAIELLDMGRGVTLLERYKVVGGRCADWVADGMRVESGLHRWLGFYKALPQLFERAGLDPEDAVIWEDELEIRLPDGGPQGVLGLSPLHRPLQTAAGLLGNFDLMSPADKAELTLFFTSGLVDYALSRRALDQQTVYDYARKRGVSEDAITNLLIPVTEGIFFLPPQRYSAMVLMGLLVPAVKRPHTIRVGAFSGGMTEVMAGPIAEAITRRGGSIQLDTTIERLAVEDGRVRGVYVNGQLIEANHVVLATSLGAAQPLIRDALGDHPWFEKMLALPTMPAVTLQIELDEPALPEDHVVFSPNTILSSYSEQSRTTVVDRSGPAGGVHWPAAGGDLRRGHGRRAAGGAEHRGQRAPLPRGRSPQGLLPALARLRGPAAAASHARARPDAGRRLHPPGALLQHGRRGHLWPRGGQGGGAGARIKDEG